MLLNNLTLRDQSKRCLLPRARHQNHEKVFAATCELSTPHLNNIFLNKSPQCLGTQSLEGAGSFSISIFRCTINSQSTDATVGIYVQSDMTVLLADAIQKTACEDVCSVSLEPGSWENCLPAAISRLDVPICRIYTVY